MNRSIQVKGAFEVQKNDYEFQRFLLRGKTRVKNDHTKNMAVYSLYGH